MDDTLNLYLKQPEPIQSCWLALRDIILKQDEEISTCVKYGAPCFLFKKKILCYLWKDKKTQNPYILFSDGPKLNHPSLLSEGRKKMKSYTFDPNEDLDIELINELIQMAIQVKSN